MDDAPGAIYRTLPRDEPSPAVDAAVLAAARRSVESRPIRKWAAPVGLAAVLVLSVGITLRVAEEKPDAQLRPALPAPQAPVATTGPVERTADAPAARVPDTSARQALPVQKAQPAARPPADPPPVIFVPSPRTDPAQPLAPSMSASPGAAAQAAPSERPAARAEARSAGPAMGPGAGASDARMERLSKSASAEVSLAAAATLTPDAWLERIAQMRAQGRHKDADESYAEFRRRFPDFTISQEMLQKIGSPRPAR